MLTRGKGLARTRLSKLALICLAISLRLNSLAELPCGDHAGCWEARPAAGAVQGEAGPLQSSRCEGLQGSF
jgi:hypothetical protein